MAYDDEIGSATIFLEASAEPPEGRRAVAWVIMNRLYSRRYGPSVTSVCLWPEQFSCWNAADPDRQRLGKTSDTDSILLDSVAALQEVQAGGTDPTEGATLYYSSSMKTPPEWAANAIFTVQIGSQLFYREEVAPAA